MSDLFARDINGTKKRFFENTLKTSGSTIIINGIETKAIIRQFKDDGVIGEDHFEAYIPIEVPVSALDIFTWNGVEYLIKVANVWQGVYTRCSINPLYQTINIKYTGLPTWQFKVCPMDESVTLNDSNRNMSILKMSSILYLKRDSISKQVQNGTRFFLYGAVYKVFGVTYANTNILKLYCEADSISPQDDVANQIADNSEITPVEVTYTITAISGANGSISPVGATTVNQGASKTFTFTPFDGYMIDKVLVDDVEVEIVDYQYTFYNVTSDHTINVTFKAIPVEKFSIVSSVANNGGSISPLGTTTLEKGQSQTYTISVEDGYAISYVKVDGVEVTLVNNQYTFENINTNHTIEVSFVEVQSFYPRVKCGYNGTLSFKGEVIGEGQLTVLTVAQGENPVLTIIPNDGYMLNTVTVDGEDYTSYVVDNTLIIDDTLAEIGEYAQIEISFRQIVYYTITATASDNCSISPNGNVSVVENGSQTFTISVDESELSNAKLKVDGVEIPYVNTYTFENVTSNHTIEVYTSSPAPKYTLTCEYNGVYYDTRIYNNKDCYFHFKDENGNIVTDESLIGSTDWKLKYNGTISDNISGVAWLFFPSKLSCGVHSDKNFWSEVTVIATVDGTPIEQVFKVY